MDPKNLGICALLCGTDYVSQATRRSKQEVLSAINSLRYENNPFLESLIDALVYISGSQSLEELATEYELSYPVANLLFCPSSITYSKKASFNLSLCSKVQMLLEKNIPAIEIQGLYDIPVLNILVFICRSVTYYDPRGYLIAILKSMGKGEDFNWVFERFTVKKYCERVKKLLKVFGRKKVFPEREDILHVCEMDDKGVDVEIIAQELMWMESSVSRWIKNKRKNKILNEGMVIESDDELQSFEKRCIIEELYASGNHIYSENIIDVDYLKEHTLLKKFQRKCQYLYD
ncbi:hypothetical protein SteCoe_28891 [Stentor coeruleus]|uniref:Uncharacterized protein n=1 Tax=Stentor coeruleus TaxID=5963 RepID=A0A1R2B777_9CILI|nr:hypothetical protein SteCoe_28891 [Stentor coeruleus]